MIILDTNVLIDLDRCALDSDELYAASILSRAELEFGPGGPLGGGHGSAWPRPPTRPRAAGP